MAPGVAGSTPVAHPIIFLLGRSQAGKAADFGSAIPRFESWRPSQEYQGLTKTTHLAKQAQGSKKGSNGDSKTGQGFPSGFHVSLLKLMPSIILFVLFGFSY